ncbi:hypothetical protein BC835DRAFT_1309205 [Cytidiella melzeri]|nr:hypothetical protein BC835DRAFT_1309205 [Cytidiella melzeri]
MSFRSSGRALWPAHHATEHSPTLTLRELSSPTKTSSACTRIENIAEAPQTETRVAVASTTLKPNHISITFTPGVWLSSTAKDDASDALAKLLSCSTLLRKENGPKVIHCHYSCEGVLDIEYMQGLDRDTLHDFYGVDELIVAISEGARCWVKAAYKDQMKRRTMPELTLQDVYSSFRIVRIQYFGPSYIKVTLVQDVLWTRNRGSQISAQTTKLGRHCNTQPKLLATTMPLQIGSRAI